MIPTSELSPLWDTSAESQVISELTMEELKKAVHKIKNNKSPGLGNSI
jgi:hypothetical protein